MKRCWALLIAIMASPAWAAPTLQPHQRTTLAYLKANPDVSGLVIYHAMGTGKTYIALAQAEARPQGRVVVIAPRFLKSNWLTQMKTYGVKNPGRFQVLSFDEAAKNLPKVRGALVIIDEVHKLIDRMQHASPERAAALTRLYFHLYQGRRRLALTGTPIFNRPGDLAFIANLVLGERRYPFNPAAFREGFMKVNPWTALIRGHLMESKVFYLWVPFYATILAVMTLATANPAAIPLVALSGSGILPFAGELFPAHQVSFREFDASRLQDFARRYISYHAPDTDRDGDFPELEHSEWEVPYNREQTSFFLSLLDGDLDEVQLSQLLGDEPEGADLDYLRVNGHAVMDRLLLSPQAGREIGNLTLGRQPPPKFQQLVATLRRPGQVAVYSSYHRNGILALARYLDGQGYQGQYVVIDPELSVSEQQRRLELYNRDKKRIVLIHPEITEGISLRGTEHFHLLEPIANIALQRQILARAVRYRSHAHLPAHRRRVQVYHWHASVEYSRWGLPTDAGLTRNDHWRRHHGEVNPSLWTKGIAELDPAFFRKDETPDDRVRRTRSHLETDITDFARLTTQHSIERL